MPSGQEDFKQLRENLNFLYIDKTQFIKEWFESYDKVTLILRPRCFGKTLNMSMIEYFFSNRYENSRFLFKDLFVSADDNLMSHQGQYPVVFLSFADLENGDCESVKNQIKMKIWQIYLTFKKEMIESQKLDITETNFVNSISYQMDDSVAINSIQILCSLLNKVYDNRQTIVLLDKYDSLFSEKINGQQSELTEFILRFISSTFKGNKFMLKGLITGILNIPLSTDFNGANNINVYTVISQKYSNYFGFTKSEVFQLAKLFQIEYRIDEIERWYGGYNFGGEMLFNPYSISQFFNQSCQFLNYWFQTSTNAYLKEILKNGFLSIKDSLIQLVQGESVIRKLNDRNDFDNKNSEEAFWNILVCFGHLTYQKFDNLNEDSKNFYYLKMPNNEIIESFSELINGLFTSFNFPISQFTDFLYNYNVFKLEQYINGFFQGCFAYFDPTLSHPEIVYHTLALGLATYLRKAFRVTLNDKADNESMYLIMKPLDRIENQRAYILAFSNLNIVQPNPSFDAAKYALNRISDMKLIERREGINQRDIKQFSFAMVKGIVKVAFKGASVENKNFVHYNLEDDENPLKSFVPKNDEDNDEEDADDDDSSYDLPDYPNFERSKKPYFNKNEEVFVIDKNRFDIWEGVISKRIYGNKYSVHYPSFPQDDEIIKGIRRILPKTKKNIDIFREQERLRNESDH